MTEYFKGDKKRIAHFTKVYSLASEIGVSEKLDESALFTLRTAAIVHDIGIKPATEKYQSWGGKLQEKEGPPVAEKMLKQLSYPEEVIERVKYLVAHHHTYNCIEGSDYQILVEADFLVNMDEDEMEKSAIKSCLEKIFKTRTGIELCKNIFDI